MSGGPEYKTPTEMARPAQDHGGIRAFFAELEPAHAGLNGDPLVTSPTISDPQADRRFRDLMSSLGIKPGVWSDGYVEYEWRHVRYMLLKYSAYFEGRPDWNSAATWGLPQLSWR